MDDYLFWGKWLALAFLVICYGFFASAETSLFSLSPVTRFKLREKPERSGKIIDRLLSQPQRLLTSIIIGNEVVVIVATVLATSLALTLWGERGEWLALLVMAPVLLLTGEIIPKAIALTYPEAVARVIAAPLAKALPLLKPLRIVLLGLSRRLMRLLGFSTEGGPPLVREDDFLRMVEDSHKVGLIAPLEKELILNLLAFSDTLVGQIMVPRPDIFSVSVTLKTPELIAAIKRARFSRVPVYGDHPEDILGILHAKDLLNLDPHQEFDATCLKNLLRPPYYVPENKRAFDLLGELQARKVRLALVVDEYGSLAGLVTVEDILEELSGEIEEEFHRGGKLLMQLAPGVYRVSSRMPLGDFGDLLDLPRPPGDHDTVGGYVFNLFGRLPHEGDTVTAENITFEVLRMKGTRIMDLLVTVD